MPRVSTIQTSFSSGALDPLLAGRTDVEHYYQGARQFVNVLPRIQGGFSRRPGSEHHATVDDPGRLEPFTFNTEQTYQVYFGDSEIKVFMDGVLQSTVVSPWPIANVFELGVTQSADTMVICHEDYQLRKLVRGTSHTSWTLSAIALTNIPLADYQDTSSPAKTEEIHTLTFSTSPVWQVGDYFHLKLADKWESERVYWTADTALLAERIRTAVVRMLTGNRTFYPDEAGNNDYYGQTSSQTVSAARIQGLTGEGVSADASGYPAVTVTLDDADADAYTELAPVLIDSVASGTLTSALTQAGSSRREPVFSATRGWPKYPAFFEGRLWFGGCKSKPQAVFASITNSYFDMGLGDSLDDEGIFILLDTDQVNAITGLIPGRKMQIMTTGGEHVIPDTPAVPTSTAPQQTDYGSLPIKPASLEGSSIFAHARGKQLMEMTFYWQEDAYNTKSVSLLSQHLISTPVQIAAQKGTSLDTANYLFCVNDDGTMAVMLTSKSQELAAWAQWTTDGNFKSVCVVEDDVYAIVERTIGNATVYYLERFSTAVYTDAASVQTFGSETTAITDLSHLNGELVKVRGDGGVLYPDETVSGGAITLDEGVTSIEVGLNFIPIVETMPPGMSLGDGSSFAAEKRYTRIDALVHETRGLTINGQSIADRQLDVTLLDTPPPQRTGMVTARPGSNTWNQLPTVTFTQQDPHPMTVLAAVLRVEANQI